MAAGVNGTFTAVSVSASDSTAVVSANQGRQLCTIYNDGTSTIYLSLGATATTTAHTVQVAAGGYYEVPNRYTGAITHKGSAASGTLRVCEVY